MSELEEYEAKIHVAGICEVVKVTALTPHMKRIAFHGSALRGLERHWRPEMLIRLYFPPEGTTTPPEPHLTADGTLEFKSPPGTEVSPFSAFSEDPLVRAYTARLYRPEALELDIDFVLHDATPGLASDWAREAKVGDKLGVVEFALPSGHRPATVRDADVYLLFADEAGLPAAQTNLEGFAPGKKIIAFLEVADRGEEQQIDTRADAQVTWLHRNSENCRPGTLLVKAARELHWPTGKVFVWACGEMKAVTEIRQFVRKERGLQKGTFKTQAYWRLGKTEVERMARMTELTIAAAEVDPASFQESFEEIGMNLIDPTLFESKSTS